MRWAGVLLVALSAVAACGSRGSKSVGPAASGAIAVAPPGASGAYAAGGTERPPGTEAAEFGFLPPAEPDDPSAPVPQPSPDPGAPAPPQPGAPPGGGVEL